MNIFLGIVLGLFSFAVHELGHYEAMRRCGIRVKEISLLGFPISFLPSIRLKIRETVWCVHLFVFGAYVTPYPEERVELKPLRDQLYVYGNGPIANFVYGFVLLSIAIPVKFIQMGQIEKAGLAFSILSALAYLTWIGRRFIAFLLPILAIPFFIVLVYLIFKITTWTMIEKGDGGMISTFARLDGADTVKAFLFAGILSISLGLSNFIPLYPLDGGRSFGAIVKAWFGKRFANVFSWVTFPVLSVLIIYSFGLDIIKILRFIF